MSAARLGPALALASALLFLLLVGIQLGRPLMYDDANFALAARAVADTGLPFGNQGWMSERGDFSQREQWALWHPPLYVYALGVLARLGGWTPPVLRVLGVLAGLATGGLTYAMGRRLTRAPDDVRSLAGGIACALVLTSPLLIQSALVLDIDLALLLPLTLGFVLAYLRLEATRWRWLVLAPFFAVLLWAKLTNPLPLLGVLVVWQILRARYTRALLHLVGIGFGGAALFGATWLIVATWLGFPLDMPFGVNLVQWRDSADVARRAYTSVGAFVEGLQPSVVWLGPGLLALGLVGAVVRCAALARERRVRGTEIVVGLSVAFVLGYVNKSAGWFPKYQVALVPLLALMAAPLAASAWCARPRLSSLVLGLGTLAAGLIDLGLVRDSWALQRTWAIEALPAGLLLGIVVLAALAGLAWRAPGAAGVTSLVAVALGWSIATSAYQATVPYQTDYWYGTTGTAAAAAWVDTHLSTGQTYVAAKEVAIRARDDRYVDQDNLVYALSLGRGFDGTWAGEPVHALVVWQREQYVAELFERSMPAAGFEATDRFGDYVVYRPTGGS